MLVAMVVSTGTTNEPCSRIPCGKGKALRHEEVGSQNLKADRKVISGIGGDLLKRRLAIPIL